MIVYWSMFLVSAAGALLSLQSSAPKYRNLIGALLIFYFIIMAFRQTGGDFITYKIYYQMIARSDLDRAMRTTEFAYAFLNYGMSRLGWGIYGVNAVCAALSIFGLYRFVRYEPFPLLTYAIATAYLIIVVAIGYTRQGTAICILLWAITELRSYRIKSFITLVLLASGFHLTAIIAMVLTREGMIMRNQFARTGISLLVFALAVYGALSSYDDTVNRYVQGYIESKRYSSDGALLRIGVSSVAAIILLATGKKLVGPDRGIWTKVCLLVAICIVILPFQSTVADRIGLYTLPLQLVVFGRLPTLAKNQRNVVLTGIAILAGYGGLLAVWMFLGNFASELWLPYKSLILGTIA